MTTHPRATAGRVLAEAVCWLLPIAVLLAAINAYTSVV